ncbi:hypothetical protein GCM10022406_18260 [Hymenobacter algoricola]|uniref:Uncharacterized protein n=1 Tax=Hymenobacter algoricola TaxID=486267 RepID=A0ABP7N0L1_9BACT
MALPLTDFWDATPPVAPPVTEAAIQYVEQQLGVRLLAELNEQVAMGKEQLSGPGRTPLLSHSYPARKADPMLRGRLFSNRIRWRSTEGLPPRPASQQGAAGSPERYRRPAEDSPLPG